jgi:hypothetical protein
VGVWPLESYKSYRSHRSYPSFRLACFYISRPPLHHPLASHPNSVGSGSEIMLWWVKKLSAMT